MSEDKIKTIIDEDLESIKNKLGNMVESLSVDTIVDVVPELIKTADKYKNLAGIEKKQLVLDILKNIIDNTDGFGDDAIIDSILKSLVPSIIDNLIKVDKKQIKLRNSNPCCLSVFNLLSKLHKSKSKSKSK